MPRFDARAAMAPEGATAGFGDLAAALLMAPQLRRKQDAEDQQRQDQLDYLDSQQQFQRDQLAQALGIHKDQMGLEQSKINNEKDYRQGENVRKWTEDFGTGLKNAAKLAIDAGGALTGNKKKSGTPSGTGWHKDQNGQFFRTAADGKIETYDPASDTIKKLGTGNPAPPASATPVAPAPSKDSSWWTLRQSGVPNADGSFTDNTLGDMLGRKSMFKDQNPADPIEGIATRRTANQQAAQPTVSPPPTAGGLQGAPLPPARVTPRRFTPEESETVRKMPAHWRQDLQQVLEQGDPDAVQKAYARIAIMRQKQQIPLLANRGQ